MTVTASALRADIYTLLDRVLETGEPLEIERKGRILRIVSDKPRGWLHKIVPNPAALVGDPEDLVSMDWSSSWNPSEP